MIVYTNGHDKMNKAQISITLDMRAYSFLRWAQQRMLLDHRLKISRAAVIEMALLKMADEMGYSKPEFTEAKTLQSADVI